MKTNTRFLLTSVPAVLAFIVLSGCHSLSPEGADALDQGAAGSPPAGYHPPAAVTSGMRPETPLMPIPEPVPRY